MTEGIFIDEDTEPTTTTATTIVSNIVGIINDDHYSLFLWLRFFPTIQLISLIIKWLSIIAVFCQLIFTKNIPCYSYDIIPTNYSSSSTTIQQQ